MMAAASVAVNVTMKSPKSGVDVPEEKIKDVVHSDGDISGSDAEPTEDEEEEEHSGNSDDPADNNDDDEEDKEVDPADDFDGDEDDDGDEELEAVGFGDAMSKILQQNVAEDAQPILAKRTTARMREIQNEKKEIKTARLSAAEKRMKEQKDMVIPDHTTLVQDRKLRMIATKGVVALFNAIAKHQHATGSTKDDKNDKKVKEMSKDNFLGLLKASQKAVTSTSTTPAATPASKSTWSVVQDDYMMGAKLKDWDATHGTEPGRVRQEDDEVEAVEDAAWKNAAEGLDSDEDASTTAGKADGKRRTSSSSGSRKGGAKKVKRT